MKSNKRLLVRCKRVIAWLLAVTMVTGTLPTSVAHAAEIPAAEAVDVVSSNDVLVSDVTANDVTAKVAEVDDSVEATVEEATKELYAEGDTASTATSNQAVVTWDDDDLAEQVKVAGFTYDYVAKQAETAYKSEGNYVTLQEYVGSAVKVKVGGEVKSSVSPTYAWQQNGAAVTGNPEAVGKYQLVATVNAGEGYTASAPTTVLNLEIKKAPVEIGLEGNYSREDWTFRAGITVAEVKTYVTEHLKFYVNDNPTAQGDIATSVTLSVVEAYSGIAPEGGDNAVLQKNQDYCVDVAVALKEIASYEVVESRFNIRLRDQTKTKIEVTYVDAKNARANGKVYDGKELVYTTADGATDYAAAGFNAKVLYDKDGKSDNGCEAELVNAEIKGTWLDADKQALAGNPVHAGVYYYLLTYSDVNGTYEFAYQYIRVEIEPAKVMLVPGLSEDFKVYDGMYVGNVLKHVDYKVYNVTATGGRGEEKTDIDKKRFWGLYDQYTEYAGSLSDDNQYYEPLFVIQRGTKENGVDKWETEPLDNWDTIQWQGTKEVEDAATGTTITTTINYNYRIVFTGYKGVYDEEGDVSSKRDINASQSDYTVSASLAVREDAGNVFVITQASATKLTINVDPICENGAGKTYANPIERTYAGTYESIYATRDEYKKAEVANGSGVLIYTWEKLIETTIEIDNQGNVKDGNLEWFDRGSWQNDVEKYCSPYEAGVYRLKVSYYDSTYATHADPAYVYYVVHPQSAKVEITGSLEIYADGVNTARDLLLSLQNVNPEDKATYVELKGYRVEATGKNTVTPVELKEGETDPVQTLIETYFNYSTTYRLNYFCVERLTKEGEENPGTWVKVNNGQKLSNDETYRISFNREYYNDKNRYTSYESEYVKDDETVPYIIWIKGNNSINSNYNFGLQLDKCNQVLDKAYYENGSATATTKTTKAWPIKIDISAFQGTEKVYDGKPLDLEALKNSIKVTATVDSEEKDVTSEVKPLLKYDISYDWYNGGYSFIPVDQVNAVHAGRYNVNIVFETNEKYLQKTQLVSGKFEIKRKEIPVKFELKETINAGVYFDGYIDEYADQTFADEILKSDNVENNVYTFELDDPVKVDAVMDGETVLRQAVDESDVTKIVGKPHYWWINESTDKDDEYNYEGFLKSSKTYYVKVTGFEYGTYVDSAYSAYGKISYDRDYVAVSEEKSFTPVRAAAKVAKADTLGTALNDKVAKVEGDVFQHTITAREDVPFNYGEYSDFNGKKQGQDSNIFRFKLYAPGEFFDEKSFDLGGYVFENAIKNIDKAGGYVESVDDNYIVVAFDLALNKSVEFEVIFGTGYTEKYVIDLSKGNMVAEADMSNAVAPKSLAFNGAPKKLAVGETVQLDVTVKKNQMADIICLGYESDNTKVLQVSETGYVTAVAKGSANITVYPCKRVNGKLDKITEGKNVSKKIKITVTDVAKPKLSKVTGRDTKAFITYTIPANGYRRELYVVKGKWKEKDFEDAIAAVVNGNYSAAFAYVNLNLSNYENHPLHRDSKNVVSNVEISGLAPECKEGYTVYLRNVSGLYTMEDGTEVATSAAGAVKNFKTTKSEAQELVVYLDRATQKVVDYKSSTSNDRYNYYKVNFADKASKVTVDAMFWQQYSKGYSDNEDYIWRPLPLGAEKGSYNVPKMKYFVSSDNEIYDDRLNSIDTSSMTKVDDHKWVYKTSLAKIDNGGKITYLGKGYVYVLAYDMVSKCYDWMTLEIDANPNSISAKAIKLQPGQSIWLSRQLEYKEGKAKVVNYQYNYYDLVTAAESSEYFKIEYVDDAHDQYDEQGGDYRITALKAGGTININVEDRVVKANGGSGTTLKITSPAVEPVKSAKVSAAYDDKFRVTFAYPYNIVNFRFELKNASGKVITDTIQTCTGKWDAKAKKYIYTVNFGNTSDWYGKDYWQEWNTYGNNHVDTVVNGRNRITLLSNYTVGITAVYGARTQVNNVDKAEAEKTQMSKTVNVKVKTTNVPASYWDVDAYNIAMNKYVKADGGASIRLYQNSNSGARTYVEDVLLRAGNTYDLEFSTSANKENLAAQKRMSDSLTWKSSNSKVASVKANSGTYTAKLVTGKQGTATIEVTSKLTKKVIARWTVTVGAVGDATKYFGENTPYKYGEVPSNDADLMKNATKLTLNNRRTVTLKYGQTQYFVFEAPAYGNYESNNEGTTIGTNSDGWYEKGEKFYIRVANTLLGSYRYTVGVSGTSYTEITLGDNTVPNGGNYVFRAPLDNWYTITYVNPEDSTDTKVVYDGSLTANEIYTLDSYNYLGDVQRGKDVTLRVTAREVKGSLNTSEAGTKITLTNTQPVWYQFDATEDNLYTFTSVGGTNVTVKHATSLMQNYEYMSVVDSDSGWINPMEANDKIYLAVSSTGATTETPVEVTIKIAKREMAGTAPAAGAAETEVTFAKDKDQAKYYAFTATADGFYKFTATGTKNEAVNVNVYASLMDTRIKEQGQQGSVVSYLKAQETIYLEVKPGEVPAADMSVKLKTEAVTTTIIGKDTQTFTLNNEGTLTVYCKLEAYESYRLEVTGDPDTTTISISVEDGNYWSYDHELYTYEDTVKITLTGAPDQKATVAITNYYN